MSISLFLSHKLHIYQGLNVGVFRFLTFAQFRPDKAFVYVLNEKLTVSPSKNKDGRYEAGNTAWARIKALHKHCVLQCLGLIN